MVLSQDAGNSPQLVNQTEFLKTSGNSSSLHQVYLSGGRSVLGPADQPANLDFQATSFGSKTSCQPVTTLCGAVSFDDQKSSAVGQFNFLCNSSTAGLNMTGNFQNVLAPIDERTGNTTGPKVDNGTDGSSERVYPNLVVLGGNTIAANSFDVGFQFFNDAPKQQQLHKPDMYFGYGFDMVEDRVQINSQMHWALVWHAPFTSPLDADGGYRAAAVEMNGQNKSGSFGILSCDTEISEVVSQLESTYHESLFTSIQSYNFSQGSMKVTSSRIPRPKALIPFIVSATARMWFRIPPPTTSVFVKLRVATVVNLASSSFLAGSLRYHSQIAYCLTLIMLTHQLHRMELRPASLRTPAKLCSRQRLTRLRRQLRRLLWPSPLIRAIRSDGHSAGFERVSSRGDAGDPRAQSAVPSRSTPESAIRRRRHCPDLYRSVGQHPWSRRSGRADPTEPGSRSGGELWEPSIRGRCHTNRWAIRREKRLSHEKGGDQQEGWWWAAL